MLMPPMCDVAIGFASRVFIPHYFIKAVGELKETPSLYFHETDTETYETNSNIAFIWNLFTITQVRHKKILKDRLHSFKTGISNDSNYGE